MKYTSTDDKQLWVLKSESWSMPVFAQPVTNESGDQFWIIIPAAMMKRSTWLILGGLIQPHSIIAENDRWIVPRETLEKIASKASGVTPRYYLRELDEEPTENVFEADESPEGPSASEDLVRACWSRSQVGKIGVFKAVWRALVNEIAHRLLIDREPVDLGWFVLHAVPYRANWKHNLLAKHPKLPAIIRNSAEQRRIAMNVHGVTADLTRTDMMATKTNGHRTTFRWSLEIETKPEWDKYQDQIETQRLTNGTNQSYLQRWGTIIRDKRKVINTLLDQFCRNLAYSAGQPIENDGGSGQRLVPFIPASGGRPVRVDRVNVPLVLDDRPSAVRGPENPENAHRKTRKVQELPVLQPDFSHLRNTRGNGSDG